jgi:hypothetical protein
MEVAWLWEPVVGQSRHPFPREPVFLTTPPKRAMPEPYHVAAESADTRAVRGNRMIGKVAPDDLRQPTSLLGYRRGPEQHATHSGCWSTVRSPGSRTRSLRTCQGLRPRRVFGTLAIDASLRFAFRKENCVGTRDVASFAAQSPGLCAPLSTLRRDPRGHLRMTRGRCGSLHLHRGGLSPPTSCRYNPRTLIMAHSANRRGSRTLVRFWGKAVSIVRGQPVAISTGP